MQLDDPILLGQTLSISFANDSPADFKICLFWSWWTIRPMSANGVELQHPVYPMPWHLCNCSSFRHSSITSAGTAFRRIAAIGSRLWSKRSKLRFESILFFLKICGAFRISSRIVGKTLNFAAFRGFWGRKPSPFPRFSIKICGGSRRRSSPYGGAPHRFD